MLCISSQPAGIASVVVPVTDPERGEVRSSLTERSDSKRQRAATEARARALIEPNVDFVWRTVRRFGVPESLADDAAQRVFIVAAERMDDILPGRERAFLFQTAIRVASETRRSLTRRREVSEQDSSLSGQLDPGPLPDEVTERRRIGVLLDSILNQMTDDLREVFVLFEFESMTVPEIAALLEIPGGTAASRLRRAREQFQKLVKRVKGDTLRGYE